MWPSKDQYQRKYLVEHFAEGVLIINNIKKQAAKRLSITWQWFKRYCFTAGKLNWRPVTFSLAIIGAYLLLFSPDRYVSTASLSIKDTDLQSMPSSFLDGLGFSGTSAGESENLLKAYIHSPNLLLALEEEMDVKNHYSQSNDFLFGLKESDEFEDYIGFYQQMVSVDIDVNTGLLTIEVQAYSPEFSKQLADALLRYGELFINQANQSVAEEEMQLIANRFHRVFNIRSA